MADRPYIYLDLTLSLCSRCLRKLETKVVEQEGAIYHLKRCPDCGPERIRVASDAAYYKRARQALKPGQLPRHFNTRIERGCPFDCGLCPDHEQHSCLALVEITDACNLTCPVCYAASAPGRGPHKSLEAVERLLDLVVRNEAAPDVVQISGGEPTIHPQILEILAAAKSRPIKHLMLNTNGVRIARETTFARRLAELSPGFEIYLQFDSLDAGPQKTLRGEDLTEIRARALEHLNELNLSTTLVVTVKKGSNDDQLGRVIEFALKEPCVRGVTFQPIQAAGRVDDFDPRRHRLTLTDIRSRILEQSALFQPEDLIPVPCNPDTLCMGYAIKQDGRATPLTRFLDPERLVALQGNTILHEQDARLRQLVVEAFSTGHSPEGAADRLGQLLCCLTEIRLPQGLNYSNVFRVLIVQFLDRFTMDVRAVKRSCIHFATEDGRLIPFDTYNLFYREGLSLPPSALPLLTSAS